MNIAMLLFCRFERGTYFRAYPWARYLVKRGHTVTLICGSPSRSLQPHQQWQDGIRILETPVLLDDGGILRRLSGVPGWCPLEIWHRTRELTRTPYDIVHAFEHHMNVSLPVYMSGKRKRGKPILVADWCDHFGAGGFREKEYSPYRFFEVYRIMGGGLRRIVDAMERRLRLRADAVTVISSYLKARAVQMGVDSALTHLVPGSANIDGIRPLPKAAAREELGIAKDRPVAAFFGSGQFDVDLALEALAIARKTVPHALFIVIGDKNEHISRKASQLGIGNDIVQTGWCDESRVAKCLASADFCLLAMRDNPFNQARWPNKIGAYMASARPTVCTRVGDVAAVVQDEEIGFVSDPCAEALAVKMQEAWSSPEQTAEMGAKARQVAERSYAPDIQGAMIESLYARLLNQRGRP